MRKAHLAIGLLISLLGCRTPGLYIGNPPYMVGYVCPDTLGNLVCDYEIVGDDNVVILPEDVPQGFIIEIVSNYAESLNPGLDHQVRMNNNTGEVVVIREDTGSGEVRTLTFDPHEDITREVYALKKTTRPGCRVVSWSSLQRIPMISAGSRGEARIIPKSKLAAGEGICLMTE